MCVSCYREAMFLPSENDNERGLELYDISLDDMTTTLKENDFHIHADATPHEIQELYTSSLNNISIHNKLVLKVLYPLYCPSSFSKIDLHLVTTY